MAVKKKILTKQFRGRRVYIVSWFEETLSITVRKAQWQVTLQARVFGSCLLLGIGQGALAPAVTRVTSKPPCLTPMICFIKGPQNHQKQTNNPTENHYSWGSIMQTKSGDISLWNQHQCCRYHTVNPPRLLSRSLSPWCLFICISRPLVSTLFSRGFVFR